MSLALAVQIDEPVHLAREAEARWTRKAAGNGAELRPEWTIPPPLSSPCRFFSEEKPGQGEKRASEYTAHYAFAEFIEMRLAQCRCGREVYNDKIANNQPLERRLPVVTVSARTCSYYFSTQIQKTC